MCDAARDVCPSGLALGRQKLGHVVEGNNITDYLSSQTLGRDARASGLPDVSILRITDALDEHETKIDSGRITLNGAFEVAIAIESSEADTIYMYLLSTIRKAIYESKQIYLMDRISQMEKGMVAHIDLLVDATRRFSKTPDLVRRAQALKEHHAH